MGKPSWYTAQVKSMAFTPPPHLAMILSYTLKGKFPSRHMLVGSLISHLTWKERLLDYPTGQQQRQVLIPNISPFSGEPNWPPRDEFFMSDPSSHRDMALLLPEHMYIPGLALLFPSAVVLPLLLVFHLIIYTQPWHLLQYCLLPGHTF